VLTETAPGAHVAGNEKGSKIPDGLFAAFGVLREPEILWISGWPADWMTVSSASVHTGSGNAFPAYMSPGTIGKVAHPLRVFAAGVPASRKAIGFQAHAGFPPCIEKSEGVFDA
jgi:hypothetical protein